MSKSKARLVKQNSDKTVNNATNKSSSTAAPAEKAGPVTATRPVQTSAKGVTRDGAKYERRQAERQQRYMAQRRSRRNRLITIVSIVVVLVAGGSLAGFLVYQSHTATTQAAASSSVAPYQEAIYDSVYPPQDNVYCDASEGQVTHIHAHVSIWINGAQSTIPQYIGIPSTTDSTTGQSTTTCFYWLHTHDTSGIVHIESPASAHESFTFGQFMDVWNGEFSSLGFPSQLLLTQGWTIWINGTAYKGSLDSIPLTAHALVTVAYNSPKVTPDKVYSWPSGY